MSENALVWIRRDLRLVDHAALAAASGKHRQVAVVFLFDPAIIGELPSDDRRLTFIWQSLTEVDQELRSQGSRLIILHGEPVEEIPRIAVDLGVSAVYTNHDYEPLAVQRDQEVATALTKLRVDFIDFKDQVIFERADLLSGSGTPFRVFTPYRKAWEATLRPTQFESHHVESGHFWPVHDLLQKLTGWVESLSELGFTEQPLIVRPGRRAAIRQLEAFGTKLADYGVHRDIPSRDGTSMLSTHLRHGTLSIREAFRLAQKHPSKGSDKWQSELVWREFYMMILDQFNHVVRTTFKPEYADLEWENRADFWEAWKHGMTGYPLVDAAMRCFNQTGWMHNRLRMVVASFLTKDLLIDYRWGEEYFARGLLDFELSSNNGGWQWAASTGVDSQPYFRIFNPILQSLKFDPEGAFIQEWVPELRGLSGRNVHVPWEAGLFGAPGYPTPVVNHDEQRPKALQLFTDSQNED